MRQFGSRTQIRLTLLALSVSGTLLGATPIEQRVVGADVYRQSEANMTHSPAVRSDRYQPNQHQPNQRQRQQSNGDPLWEILTQVQALQTEVSELRGAFDQQSYELQQLKMQQKQHYIDLDQRIEALNGSPPRARMNQTQTTSKTLDHLQQQKQKSPSLDAEAIKSQYQNALGFVKERDYAQAENALTTLLASASNSFYEPFAHYWLAEVLLAKMNPEINRAQKHFELVIHNHPDHAKRPASLYKLGTIHHVTGDPAKAKKVLRQLIEEYARSSEAGMASRYLEQM